MGCSSSPTDTEMFLYPFSISVTFITGKCFFSLSPVLATSSFVYKASSFSSNNLNILLQELQLGQSFGTSSVNLTYLGESDGDKVYVEISEADMTALGLSERPYMRYGKLFIHPTKTGSCKLTIRAVAGGSIVGGGDKIGGMEVSQTLSVLARDFKSDNGGWL